MFVGSQDYLIKQAAIRARDRYGLSVVPVRRSTKRAAIYWTALQTAFIENWDYPNCDLAVITGPLSGVVVADCDSEDAVVWWTKNRTPTPLMVRSRRGVHFYYAHPGVYVKSGSHLKIENIEFDVKGDNGLCVLPPSTTSNGGRYRVVRCDANPTGMWVQKDNLPVFDPNWRIDMTKPMMVPTASKADTSATVKHAWNYIKRIYAVAGSGGNKATYQVACTLRRAGLTAGEAFHMICHWNQTNAQPEWTERELEQKIKSAYR